MRPPRAAPAPDPLLGEVGGGVVRPGWAELAAAVGSSSVVVGLVLGKDTAQVAFAEDEHPVGDLGPGGEHEPFGISVRARTPGRNLYGFDAGAGQDRVKGCSELPGTVADEELEVRSVVAEVHQQIADLLGGPWPVRVRGDPEDMNVAVADFDDEEAVQAPEGHAVHVEEVDGEHRGGLRVQELAPGRVGVPLGCRGYLQSLENPSDGGRADPMTELEKLALNALIPPGGVLGGEPLDQRGDLGTDRRPARPVRIGPLPRAEAAVPPQHTAGCDQPVIRRLPGRSRISAARTARSAQSSRGLGVVRRSTATSCRSTSSSMSLEAGERPSRTSQPQSRMKIR